MEESTNDISNHCQVCDDFAQFKNFGAFACESCKAFFRRNAHKDELLKLCSKGCVINKETRKMCKSCRLQKCYSAGMDNTLIKSLSHRENRKRKLKEIKEDECRNTDKPNTYLEAFLISLENQERPKHMTNNIKLTDTNDLTVDNTKKGCTIKDNKLIKMTDDTVKHFKHSTHNQTSTQNIDTIDIIINGDNNTYTDIMNTDNNKDQSHDHNVLHDKTCLSENSIDLSPPDLLFTEGPNDILLELSLSEHSDNNPQPDFFLSENPINLHQPELLLSENPTNVHQPELLLSENQINIHQSELLLSENPRNIHRPELLLSENPRNIQRPECSLSEIPTNVHQTELSLSDKARYIHQTQLSWPDKLRNIYQLEHLESEKLMNNHQPDLAISPSCLSQQNDRVNNFQMLVTEKEKCLNPKEEKTWKEKKMQPSPLLNGENSNLGNSASNITNNWLEDNPIECDIMNLMFGNSLCVTELETNSQMIEDTSTCLGPETMLYSDSVPNDVLIAMKPEFSQCMKELLHASEVSYDKAIIEHIVERPDIYALINQVEGLVRKFVSFSRALPLFTQLSDSDQLALVKGSFLDLLTINILRYWNCESNTLYTRHKLSSAPHTEVVTKVYLTDALLQMTPSVPFMHNHFMLTEDYSNITYNDPAIAMCLIGHFMFKVRPQYNYTNVECVQHYCDLFLNTLENYISVAHAHDSVDYTQLLSMLPRITRQGLMAYELLDTIPIEGLSEFTKVLFYK